MPPGWAAEKRREASEMAVTDWMRFQLAYGFGSVMAAKALEKWHSPTLLFHTEDWRLRQHGMKEDELRRVQKAKDGSGYHPAIPE